MDILAYDENRDLENVERIWKEVGWVDSDGGVKFLRTLLSAGVCLTARLNGQAECAVHTVPGTIQHRNALLNLCVVTAVTTSRVARRQGFAQRLTALQLAAAARDGAQVAALGMFDQGFYDKLGFGTAAYDNQFTFDPASLRVPVEFRVPVRLGNDDWREMHAAMLRRMPNHGGCSLTPPEVMQVEVGLSERGFGLGYRENGELTHFFWGSDKGEHGPYEISFMAYRSSEQLLELLALLKSLGDQVYSITLLEPPHVQLQALLKQPFRYRRSTRRSDHGNEHKGAAWSQLRLLDLPGCLASYRWYGRPLVFNLNLSDPLAGHLEDSDWQGIGGEYRMTVGETSSAVPGADNALPTLAASCNAFTRLFFGVANASSLAITDDFAAPEALLRDLDEAFCLPAPRTSWDF